MRRDHKHTCSCKIFHEVIEKCLFLFFKIALFPKEKSFIQRNQKEINNRIIQEKMSIKIHFLILK